MAPRLRPLLTPPNDGTQMENRLDLRVALKTGAGHAHRDILALIDICGLSYDEAALVLAVPRGTVMSRVCRARRALAQMLGDEHRVIPFPTTRDRP